MRERARACRDLYCSPLVIFLMDTCVIDYETYYVDGYSLSSMTTEAYIRDPRFEVILVSVKWNDTPAFWLLPDRFKMFVDEEVDWENTALITHHAHFDGAILNWHYGKRPAMHICTLSAARVIDGPKAGNSLRELCIRHGIGHKGDYVTTAKGKHLADFSSSEIRAYGDYCVNDTERTYDLAQIFLPQLPASELQLIDLTVRMFTEPVFIGDIEKLRGAVATEKQRKIELLRRINLICPVCLGYGTTVDLLQVHVPCKKCKGTGVDAKPIGSTDQFANLLRAQNVEPKMKVSPTLDDKGNQRYIYAFARTDSFMQELLEHEDENVRFLAEARIGVKSNIIETRAERFANCASRGPLPVYLLHAGAHTLRPSGGDGMNFLNMSKFNAKRPELMVLRQSIKAPPGYKIVAVDSSQGEARILSWLSGQDDLTEAFRQGRDVYSEHATVIYGRPIDGKKNKEDHVPRQVAKVGILSYGFGSGWYKSATELLKGALGADPIQFTIRDMESMGVDPSRFLNNPKKVALVGSMPSRLELNDRLAHCAVVDALVYRYRQKYQKICGKQGFWSLMETVIDCMISGKEMVFGAHGIMRTGKECIYLPGGLKLNYRGISRSDGDASYFDGRERQKIYSTLATENVVQTLHRLIVSEQMLKIADAGIKVALWPYDEVVAVVPEDAAEVAKDYMIQVMKTSPEWATGLPLAAEGKVGNTYAEC